MREDSLCWTCQNSTSDMLCPWVGGKEVDGWEAEPTVIKNRMEGKTYITHSYYVKNCPLYKEDYKRITADEMAILFAMTVDEVRTARTKVLRKLFKEKGFDLRTSMVKSICKDKECSRRFCYIKKIER